MNDWDDASDFLDQLSRKRGRLLAGGDADADGMARIVLNDFLRGKIPWFTPPPDLSPEDQKAATLKGRAREEAAKKRKRNDADSKVAISMGATWPNSTSVVDDKTVGDDAEAEKEEDAEDFSGFGSDSAPSDFGSDEDDMISLGSISDDESDYGDATETAGANDEEDDEDEDEDEDEEGAEDGDGSVAVSSDEEEAPPEPQQKPKAKRQKR